MIIGYRLKISLHAPKDFRCFVPSYLVTYDEAYARQQALGVGNSLFVNIIPVEA